MLTDIKTLFAYNSWANTRMLECVAKLDQEQYNRDMGNSFPSVKATMEHILGAEWIWWKRWHGESPAKFPNEWDVSTFEALQQVWQQHDQAYRAFGESLSEGDLDRNIVYHNIKGDKFENKLGDLCRHVLNHSTYHRGQVTTLLRQLGAEAVSTDLIFYYRSLQ